uniref:Cytochrome c oxidase subunit 2 n=1 Tax=Wolfiporia cocos TaxID=81056 RepID=A0A7G7YDX7_9APHY|nr:cytochrome c oxidase subunit 2 [Wolfiporia cocos]
MYNTFSIFNTIFNDAPQPWQIGFQDNFLFLIVTAAPGFTGIVELHNTIFFYLVVISVGVFWVLGSVIYYYNSNKSPIVHKYLNHGTAIELIWTITPALVLIAIAFPSFRLLYLLDEVISPTISIKVVGHQWYWYIFPTEINLDEINNLGFLERTYEYSDYINESGESIEFDSYMIPEDSLELGQFRLLDVDNKVVIPIDTHVRLIVTVIKLNNLSGSSFAVPSLGIKIDACPGHIGQVKLQCSEICGTMHGMMPIAIEAVSVQDYLQWLDSFSSNDTPIQLPGINLGEFSYSSLGHILVKSSSKNKPNNQLSPNYVTGTCRRRRLLYFLRYKKCKS